MINYSVFMLGNPLKKEEPAKAYAKNQFNEVWSLNKFVRHIADHNGVYTRGTVRGVVSDMCECLVEQLLNGNKVELGELGSFGISLSSEGAKSIPEFTSKNIKAVNIVFTPGEEFENLIGRAEFTPVATRAAQNATYKAERQGEKTVDLEAAKNKNQTTGGSPTTGEDSGSSSEVENPLG